MKNVLLGLTLTLVMSSSFAGTGCVLVGSPAARVDLLGKNTPLPLRLANCEGVKIVSGPVSACFIDKKQQRTCRQLNQGEVFSGEILGSMEGAGTAAFQATVIAMLLGDSHAPAGGSRSSEQIPGLPYANIVGRGDQIVFSSKPQAIPGEEILEFALAEDFVGAPSKIFKPVNGTIYLPTGELTRGQTYVWEAHTKSNTYTGAFHLAATDRADSMKEVEVSVVRNLESDPISSSILLAEKYFENGFAFDANQILLSVHH